MMPSTLCFFHKMALATQSLLWFHINFKIVCSIFVKKTIRIFIEIALNLYVALDSIDFFAISVPPIHEYGIFSVCVFFFFNHLQLSYSFQFSFISLGKFIPWCFILSDAVANGIAFSISLADSLPLVYRNTTYFYILILYSATLLNLLVLIYWL